MGLISYYLNKLNLLWNVYTYMRIESSWFICGQGEWLESNFNEYIGNIGYHPPWSCSNWKLSKNISAPPRPKDNN